MKTFAAGIALFMILCGLAQSGEHWSQWRGPSLDGTTDSIDLPLHWSETENIRWKVPLPSWSGSTPAIWGDRIFVASPSAVGSGPDAPTAQRLRGSLKREGQDLLLLCYSKQDGSLLWRTKLADGNVHYGKQNMSSPSPITDGMMVWALTGTGVLTALDMDGHPIWTVDLQEKYGEFGLNWGYGASPLLFAQKLIVPVLHGMNTDDPSYLVAFAPATGEVIWKVERPTDAKAESPDAYTTPVPMTYADRTEILVSGGDCLTAHDLETGKEVWRCGGLNPTDNAYYRTVASPVRVGDLVVACAKQGPTVACRAGGKGDVTETHTAWTSKTSYDVPTPVTDGKYLYLLNDRGFMSCLDPTTGEALYERQRLPRGTYDASPLVGDGKIYLTNEGARTTVIATGPDFKVLAENQLEDDYTLASIAVSGNELFIRTSTHLYCVGDT